MLFFFLPCPDLRRAFLLLCSFVLTTIVQAVPGVEKQTLLLGGLHPLTGPAKELSNVYWGALVYFQYINDQGGVHGRKINYQVADSRLKAEGSELLIQDLLFRQQVFAFFSTIGAGVLEVQNKWAIQQDVPQFFIGNNLPQWTQPVFKSRFGFYPTLETEANILAKYIDEHYSQGKIIVWFRREIQSELAAKRFMERIRNRSVVLIPYESRAPLYQLQAEMNQIAEYQAQAIVVLGEYEETYAFLWQSPNFSIPIYTGTAIADSRIVKQFERSTLQNLYVLSMHPFALESEHPGIQLHQALLQEYQPKIQMSRWTIYGQATAELMLEVLARTGRNLNRHRTIQAAESLQNWQGPLTPPINLSPSNHLAITSMRVSQILPEGIIHQSRWISGNN